MPKLSKYIAALAIIGSILTYSYTRLHQLDETTRIAEANQLELKELKQVIKSEVMPKTEILLRIKQGAKCDEK